MTSQLDRAVKRQVADLRKAFVSGKTRSIEFRRKQLQSFQSMMIDNRERFEAAMKEDLGETT